MDRGAVFARKRSAVRMCTGVADTINGVSEAARTIAREARVSGAAVDHVGSLALRDSGFAV